MKKGLNWALLNKDNKEGLAENKRTLKDIPKRIRRDFAAFFEDIAFMRNAGLITKEVACNMFSHDAIECWYRDEFWYDFKNKDDAHWGALRLFVEEMAEIRPSLKLASIGGICLFNTALSKARRAPDALAATPTSPPVKRFSLNPSRTHLF